jgi:hypothetical protein
MAVDGRNRPKAVVRLGLETRRCATQEQVGERARSRPSHPNGRALDSSRRLHIGAYATQTLTDPFANRESWVFFDRKCVVSKVACDAARFERSDQTCMDRQA